MQRRHFLRAAGALTAGAALSARAADAIQWKMVTAWPKNFPALGTGANKLAELIGEMSGGRLRVKVFGAGELVPALEVFDAVAKGTAQMGHGAAYYWKGKAEASQFFTAVPFGFTGQEMNAWMYYGGGLKLYEEVYAPFGLIPFPAGNSGAQMGGWFNKEINSVEDLKGLKMRLPGLGGEVLKRLGGVPQNTPGGEIFTALSTGALDATEWVGPYNDLAFGLHKAARHYYYPGWHEAGPSIEGLVNKAAFEALPKDLQSIVRNAARVVNDDMMAEYTARNASALKTLAEQHKVVPKPFPPAVLRRLREVSLEVVAETAKHDPVTARVHASFSAFYEQVRPWTAIAEHAYLNARAG
jgi:TRAP-type mannitol/chloroaromatic compound transport system substrate-binding protein